MSVFSHKTAALRSSLVAATLCAFAATCASASEFETHHHKLANEEAVSDAPQGGVIVRDLPLEGGQFQRVLYDAPPSRVRGIIVMFSGGADDIGIEKDGVIRHGDNFVVRSRDLWTAKGYGVVLVDAIDHQSMRGKRSTDAYAAVTREVVAFAHEQADAPVWVMGTSQGSIAAMNAASHARGEELAGVILTESVSILGASHETVFDAHPEDVHVPALVVANKDDRCKVAPPSMADAIAHSMRNTRATVLFEQGGEVRSSNECASLSPHGYYGIEDKVVNDIAEWMAHVGA
ncbi:alpha/beta hydrolase [Paraburkholderia sp. BCC1885]|uniref:alpha/beta hydrolase n=1 Tax=Paraburkholderia sp. BCC1885 TaxID=2562669 RepID=UPI001C8FD1EB|nr:alpha/beta hydrolase [Paraburkholderia sp. BCC1885]